MSALVIDNSRVSAQRESEERKINLENLLKRAAENNLGLLQTVAYDDNCLFSSIKFLTETTQKYEMT